jgi:putative ABC transport system substrate-binding protein
MTRYAFRLAVLVLAILGASLAVDAQQPGKVARIGYLSSGSPTSYAHLDEAFRQQLRELGYVEGQNIVIEYRWAEGGPSGSPTSWRSWSV